MNAAGFPLLSLITWLPLVGGVVIMSVRGDQATINSNARWTALWTSLIVLVLSLVLWFEFDPGDAGFQFVENVPWLAEYGVGYKMGVDGISVLFVLLTTVLDRRSASCQAGKSSPRTSASSCSPSSSWKPCWWACSARSTSSCSTCSSRAC